MILPIKIKQNTKIIKTARTDTNASEVKQSKIIATSIFYKKHEINENIDSKKNK